MAVFTTMHAFVLLLLARCLVADDTVGIACGEDMGSQCIATQEASKAAAMLQVTSNIHSSGSHPSKAKAHKSKTLAKEVAATAKKTEEKKASKQESTHAKRLKETHETKEVATAHEEKKASKQEATHANGLKETHETKEAKASSKKHLSLSDATAEAVFVQSQATMVEIQEQTNGLIWRMIRPDPWVCDLIPDGDHRHNTCGMEPSAENLNPKLLNCGDLNSCTTEHANAYRTLSLVGALPCCPTAPFCAAPSCSAPAKAKDEYWWTTPKAQPSLSKWTGLEPVCTKRAPRENVAYMKLQETWPAYHGFGGAFELDIAKIFDVIAHSGEGPFDLAFDFGANYGYYTELLTVRSFAKNYVMVEANPRTTVSLRTRWGNDDWKTQWFSRQVPHADGATMPQFEIIAQALSDKTGVLDMCATEASFYDIGCEVPINTVDHLVTTLTPEYQDHFKNAQTAFVKVDTEGMDELVLRGMTGLLNETRGKYANGAGRYLVNFLQFEYSPQLMKDARQRENFTDYSIKTATNFLESIGWETFLVGPRYLPLSHGSWDEEFKTFPEDVHNNAGHESNYPNFAGTMFHSCKIQNCKNTTVPSFTSDIFAIRASHPRAAEIKIALGACMESKDMDIADPSYGPL